MSNTILLQHDSYGNTKTGTHNMEILQSGYLRSSLKTGNTALHGDEPIDWIFVRINTDSSYKTEQNANYYINPICLLKTKFILHIGWVGDVEKNDIIIDGTKLTKNKLIKLLENFKQRAKLQVDLKCILNEDKHHVYKRHRMWTLHSNEILIKNDIDLHKYLVNFRGSKKEEEYYREHYLNKKKTKKTKTKTKKAQHISPVPSPKSKSKSSTRKSRTKINSNSKVIYATDTG